MIDWQLLVLVTFRFQPKFYPAFNMLHSGLTEDLFSTAPLMVMNHPAFRAVDDVPASSLGKIAQIHIFEIKSVPSIKQAAGTKGRSSNCHRSTEYPVHLDNPVGLDVHHQMIIVNLGSPGQWQTPPQDSTPRIKSPGRELAGPVRIQQAWARNSRPRVKR